ncbi:MAG TPA: dihydrofolate reductase family protein [Anaerolineales bacterium]|nr:dihydrofolate reductase family protein [Anaerolineales bacterium]
MSRPFVRINVAATADGKIDTVERRGAAISSARDKQRVDELRAESDAVMVGGRTLHDEDPRLTVKSEALRRLRQERGLPPNPVKAAVASRLELQPDCHFLNEGPARILLFTSARTDARQLDMLRSAGARVVVLGSGEIDLAEALRILKEEEGIERLMVEGGATFNYALLKLGLVDEISVYVAPMVFGGGHAPTLAGGAGLPRGRAIALKLLGSEQWDDGGVLLRYEVVGPHG